MKIGIVIPTYKSEKKIKKLITLIERYVPKNTYFLCFVDGSPNNKTILEIKKKLSKNYIIIKEIKKNSFLKISTRCLASKIGFKWLIQNTKCQAIVDLDSDLAHDPKDITKGSSIILSKKADLVIASKYRDYSKVFNRQIIRKFISYIYTKFCRILFSKKISDYSNSYRFYSKHSLKKLLNEKNTFNSPVQHLENLLFYIKNNYRIKEISSVYKDTGEKSASIRKLHLLIFIFQLFFLMMKNIHLINKIK